MSCSPPPPRSERCVTTLISLAARFTFGLVNSLVEWYHPGGPIEPDELADAVLAYVRTGLRMSETGDFR